MQMRECEQLNEMHAPHRSRTGGIQTFSAKLLSLAITSSEASWRAETNCSYLHISQHASHMSYTLYANNPYFYKIDSSTSI